MNKQTCLLFFLTVCFPIFSYSQTDLLSDSFYYYKRPSPSAILAQTIAPGILITNGIICNGKSQGSVKHWVKRQRDNIGNNFSFHVDDYLQFTPLALAYGFEAVGMKPKTDLINRSVILLKSEVLMMATVTLIKNSSKTLRPDSSGHSSFPSGHTAQAFAAATILSEEYGRRYKWVPFLAYGMASSVGVLRVMNNRHFISDVLVGAGIGILSTKIAYWTHQYKWGKQSKIKRIM
jgi:membrane-associated phospholipid phosphatase